MAKCFVIVSIFIKADVKFTFKSTLDF